MDRRLVFFNTRMSGYDEMKLVGRLILVKVVTDHCLYTCLKCLFFRTVLRRVRLSQIRTLLPYLMAKKSSVEQTDNFPFS